GIYCKMALVYVFNMFSRARQPFADLLFLNISLILSILLRYGVSLEYAPNYNGLQWISIFIVYSILYMITFYFSGMYHRYKNNPERALFAGFVGFLFHIFIINFINQYNFSRIASFYCWGFNSILISGWRFILEIIQLRESKLIGRKTIIIGRIADAVKLRRVLSESGLSSFDVSGCVETSRDAIRGTEVEGLHVLGLVGELNDIIREYSVDVVIMVGSNIPFSKILNNGGRFGSMRTEFMFVPDLTAINENKEYSADYITLVDINSSGMLKIRGR
ncbi:MAG TPA: hypothetical protein ENH82_08025, partial [bacterium]|nr:hypothetical protein [bacterium]